MFNNIDVRTYLADGWKPAEQTRRKESARLCNQTAARWDWQTEPLAD